MRMERLGEGGSPAQVLRALGARARDLGIAPPAALTGIWFGAAAVIAPSLEAAPAPVMGTFTRSDRMMAPRTREGGPVIGGGWMGYLAYPDRAPTTPALPVAAGGWTDVVLRLDDTGGWWYETLTDAPCPPDLAAAVHDPDPMGAGWRIDWTPPDRAAHRHGVEQCLDAIRAGEVYQACVCTRFTGTWSGDPLAFFADAVERTRPNRAAYLQGPWGAVASLSPELFLACQGDRVESGPIKGTLPLHRDPAELRASVKDVAENVMIVDLVRNDLGRVAETGTVTVPDLLGVHPAPGVWHLVSTVAAALGPGVTADALLDATFPPASVTGCPKLRARDLLQDWETHPRGVYCGTVGMAGPLAGLEMNVAIRTVEFAGSECALGVGGGITIDSDPDAEWQECLDKAASILQLSPGTRPVRRPAARTAGAPR
ncbi:aminodeoxychorismate synthase component I [Rhodococcus zopfii]|uniref:aminodeoxychorismate synthase component I n=1 Tax=Rhodococcus zopfii TaxID=43772 RepID=UPI0011111230|nr:aminodeoxychorismate synthase component I [Rhodococcus zopfii]